MQLTAAQKTALKNDLLANQATPSGLGSTIASWAANGSVNRDPTKQQIVADWYNQTASPAYYGARTDAPVADICNAIQWPKFTPAPSITSGNAAQASAASNYAMAKQNNLLLLGVMANSRNTGTFDASKATQTNGLKDAITNLPTAASFANQDANWTGSTGCVANQLVRTMTAAEKVLSGANGVGALNDGTTALGGWNTSTGAGNAASFGAQGALLQSDVDDVIANG